MVRRAVRGAQDLGDRRDGVSKAHPILELLAQRIANGLVIDERRGRHSVKDHDDLSEDVTAVEVPSDLTQGATDHLFVNLGHLTHHRGPPFRESLGEFVDCFREPLGRSKFEFQAKFPDSTSMVGEFSMGNEPSFAIPYLYNRLGEPWKTQKRVRMLLESFFPDTLQGIPGDEDGGGMSAFVVFSMMGFYPVTPGIPVYDIGSPVFAKTTIHLRNGKDFVIVAKGSSRENKYVRSVRLNGKVLEQVWFRHAEVADGGRLELEMGDAPNRALGAGAGSAPPAGMGVLPENFGR